MALLKRKTILAALVVLAILIGLGLIFLPGLVAKTFNSGKALEVKALDYHSILNFSLGDQGKLDELVNSFNDVIFGRGYKRVNIILTDVVQPQKIYWMNGKNKLINHLGYDVQSNDRSLDIFLYNNWSALSESGWSVEKIQRENELLLIRALLNERGVTGKILEDQVKDIYLIIHKSYPNSMFYLTYEM